jgi:hypothetical protein
MTFLSGPQEFEFQNDDLLDHPTFVTPYPYGDEDDDADEVHNSNPTVCRLVPRAEAPTLTFSQNRSPRPLPTEARRGNRTATVTNRHTNKALQVATSRGTANKGPHWQLRNLRRARRRSAWDRQARTHYHGRAWSIAAWLPRASGQ